jgi:hypothetical protein
MRTLVPMAVVAVVLAGCTMPYLYTERSKALVPGIDVEQSLAIAEMELEKGGVLGLWVLRDQPVTAKQAARISEIYFDHIDEIDAAGAKNRRFQVWHLTWAIANLYRLGGASVKAELEEAYLDAGKRVEALDMKVATLHYGGDELYMGDAHGGGRAYAEKHLVVPGNPDYLQSLAEYVEGKPEEPQLMLYAEPTRSDTELLGSE